MLNLDLLLFLNNKTFNLKLKFKNLNKYKKFIYKFL